MEEMIEISIYESAAGRFSRLGKVLAYVYAKAEHYNNRDLAGAVKRLHDHKGMLEVTWRRHPTEGEEEWFAEAWEAQNEPAEEVKHSLDGRFD